MMTSVASSPTFFPTRSTPSASNRATYDELGSACACLRAALRRRLAPVREVSARPAQPRPLPPLRARRARLARPTPPPAPPARPPPLPGARRRHPPVEPPPRKHKEQPPRLT